MKAALEALIEASTAHAYSLRSRGLDGEAQQVEQILLQLQAVMARDHAEP